MMPSNAVQPTHVPRSPGSQRHGNGGITEGNSQCLSVDVKNGKIEEGAFT